MGLFCIVTSVPRLQNFLIFLEDCIKHTVDEGGALFGGELLGQFDGFVDDDARRGGGIGQLPYRQAQNAAIDTRLAADGPLGGDGFDPLIGNRPLLPGSLGSRKGIAASGGVVAVVDDLVGHG